MKRFTDVALSLVGLVLFAPMLALTMLMIRIESRGSPLFAQQRIGQNGRIFTCYKLRTMYSKTADLPTHEISASAVTQIGSWLRKLKFDELPQLYNVLLGQMSLVGPRPCLPSQFELIEARNRVGVLKLVPGITGLAQIRQIDMSDPERLATVDAEYAQNVSFSGDLKILLATISGQGRGVDRVRTS